MDPANFKRQVNARAKGVKVPDRLMTGVVPAPMRLAAGTNRFF